MEGLRLILAKIFQLGFHLKRVRRSFMSGKISKEVKQPGTAEIEAIRSIIFGEQEKYFSQKIQELEEQIKKLQKEFSKRFDDLTNRASREKNEQADKLSTVRAQLDDRNKDLEQKINNLLERLEKGITELQQKKIDGEFLSHQLIEFAKILHTKS